MVLSWERTNTWLITTPAMAPNGLKDWDRFSRWVAVCSCPMAQTYELAEVYRIESPAKRINIAARYIMKLRLMLPAEVNMAG